MKKFAALFTAAIMALSLCSCQGEILSKQTESERFEEYLDDSFTEALSSDLFNLHFFFIHP